MKHTLFPLICILCATLSPRAAEPTTSTGAPGRKELPLPGEVFNVGGRAAFLIPAQKAPEGTAKPWVWYAPTLPGLPGPEERWMFEQFLSAGLAIAGIDVGESYGSPGGRSGYTALYSELTGSRGYSRKPALLGRSRGGLMLLSWAADNPDRVAAFAGIYPVCNLVSYPGVAKATEAYGLTGEELQGRLAEHNPIDRLAPLARAGVPLYAIHGDVDTLVPLADNSGLMQARYTALGGRMGLNVPAGQGHNMWVGFFQSGELVQFLKFHALAAAAGPGNQGKSTPSAGSVEEGFVSMFNGQDLAGWEGPGAVVRDGELVYLGSQGGALMYTRAEYTNFVFRFEFRFTPSANSGLNFRTDGPTWNEIQILDDVHPLYTNIHPYQAHGSIYGVVPAKRGFLKPTGEWNFQEVRADGPRIRVTLNGTVIVDADLSKLDLDKCVDGLAHPGLRRTYGKIGWLAHLNAKDQEGPVHFRNLRIKQLP